jgi:hypothetical protein
VIGRADGNPDEVRESVTSITAPPDNMRSFYRYSEFDDLRAKLVAAFPKAKSALPPLPPKSIICMYHIQLLKQYSGADRLDSQIQPQVPGNETCWAGLLSQVSSHTP